MGNMLNMDIVGNIIENIENIENIKKIRNKKMVENQKRRRLLKIPFNF